LLWYGLEAQRRHLASDRCKPAAFKALPRGWHRNGDSFQRLPAALRARQGAQPGLRTGARGWLEKYSPLATSTICPAYIRAARCAICETAAKSWR